MTGPGCPIADGSPGKNARPSRVDPEVRGRQRSASYSSNFGERRKANYIYLTATLDAATWGAELAVGEGPSRIYRVEPTGPFEDDPNLTDKKFPGNPTRSYRTREPLRVVAEILDWEPASPEVL